MERTLYCTNCITLLHVLDELEETLGDVVELIETSLTSRKQRARADISWLAEQLGNISMHTPNTRANQPMTTLATIREIDTPGPSSVESPNRMRLSWPGDTEKRFSQEMDRSQGVGNAREKVDVKQKERAEGECHTKDRRIGATKTTFQFDPEATTFVPGVRSHTQSWRSGQRP